MIVTVSDGVVRVTVSDGVVSDIVTVSDGVVSGGVVQ